MKKITLLMAFVACVVFAQAQTNLLVNPSFETWTNGAPTGWTLGNASYAAVSENTSLFSEGTKSLTVTPVSASGGTYSITQLVPVTAGKTYTLKMSYYIVTGDGTDARIWCNFKNTAGAYWKMNLADSLAMKGPNATATAGYFPDVKGSWQTYTYDVVAPVGFETLDFTFRTYKTPALVNWDNMFVGEKTTGLNDLSAEPLQAVVSGKNLLVKNATDGSTVEIYSAVGSKVQSSVLENGQINLNDLSKGMYVVRVGKLTQKIML